MPRLSSQLPALPLTAGALASAFIFTGTGLAAWYMALGCLCIGLIFSLSKIERGITLMATGIACAAFSAMQLFLLAVLTIVYIGFLCYVNMIGIENLSSVLYYLSIYGGVAIALLYAAINFFGNPLKIVFFILLVVMVILLILTSAMPGVFRSIFKLGNDGKELIEPFLNIIR